MKLALTETPKTGFLSMRLILPLVCFLVCFRQRYDHLQGRADILAIVCVVFSCGLVPWIRYLIVSNPDLYISLNLNKSPYIHTLKKGKNDLFLF